MPDDEMIALLKEIRDLQRQHVENYKDALANQRYGIRLYKRAMMVGAVIVLIMVGFIVLIYSTSR